ncbi:hypothetical protein FACS1894216_04890 [Synergistales bacterium]|nr:hypothetical protein FACS1894216_04890 [Synergistales bacterium]
MKKYFYATISPASSGFGEYQQDNDIQELWDDDVDLWHHIVDRAYGDTVRVDNAMQALPDGVDNIYGAIHDQRGALYVTIPGVDDAPPRWWAIVEVDEEIKYAIPKGASVLWTPEQIKKDAGHRDHVICVSDDGAEHWLKSMGDGRYFEDMGAGKLGDVEYCDISEGDGEPDEDGDFERYISLGIGIL